MATTEKKQATPNGHKKSAAATKQQPRSLDIASRGIKTDRDFADLMSAVISDLIDGSLTPAIGNATCNAGGKLLKIVELKYKYGTQGKAKNEKVLILATGV